MFTGDVEARGNVGLFSNLNRSNSSRARWQTSSRGSDGSSSSSPPTNSIAADTTSLRVDPEQYNGRRWYQPFTAKCDAKGIDPAIVTSILENAQTLLDGPAGALAELVVEGE